MPKKMIYHCLKCGWQGQGLKPVQNTIDRFIYYSCPGCNADAVEYIRIKHVDEKEIV